MPPLLLYGLIGLGAGTVSGFFGVGGGLVIVPALVYFAHFPQHKAVGTSLAVLLLPVGLGAVLEYYRAGNVDFRAAFLIAIGLFLAAWAAGHLANKVGALPLKLAFGVFTTLVGVYITFTTLAKLGK